MGRNKLKKNNHVPQTRTAGPQMGSKGVAPDEAEAVSGAYTKAQVEGEFATADAPGEGKR